MASIAPTIEEAICGEFNLIYNEMEGLYTAASGYLEGSRSDVIIADDWVAMDDDAGLRTAAIQKLKEPNGQVHFALLPMNLMPVEPALSILKELSKAMSNIKIEAATEGGEQPETSLEKWFPLVEVYSKTKQFLEGRT